MNLNKKILIIDSDNENIDFLSYSLRKEGYKVYVARTSAEGIDLAIKEQPTLIILEIILPDIDGIETCWKLRENPKFEKTLIVFLTSRGEVFSEVSSFNAGADDFVVKPIRSQAFICRINTMINKNSKLNEENNIFEFGNILINKDQYLVSNDGLDIHLPKKAFEILFLLCTNANKLLSREEIHEAIWIDDQKLKSRTIDVYINKIRESIGERYINTVKGVGYKFNHVKAKTRLIAH